jgi:hypothetical protein
VRTIANVLEVQAFSELELGDEARAEYLQSEAEELRSYLRS